MIFLAAPPALAFPLAYAMVSRNVWWRTATGRALMASSSALAVLIGISLAFVMFGDYELRGEVRLGAFALVALGAWLKFGALVHEAWRGGRDDDA